MLADFKYRSAGQSRFFLDRQRVRSRGVKSGLSLTWLSSLKFTPIPETSLSLDGRKRRLNGILLAAVAFAALTVMRLYSLQGTEYKKWMTIASKQHYSRIQVQGARGTVMDTAGRTLAVSVPALAVGIRPRRVRNLERDARELSRTLNLPLKEVKEKLVPRKKFVWLARGVAAKKRTEIEALQMDAVELFDEFRRFYPQGAVAGPLIGKVGLDGEGLSGLELQFNRKLLAPDYNLPVRRDARGRYVTAAVWENEIAAEPAVLRELGSAMDQLGALWSGAEPAEPSVVKEPLRKEGRDITLSIDAVIQSIVESEFDKGKQEAIASKVFGLVMDADSGELLALAQSPGMNPSKLEDTSSAELRNFVLQDSFEPGSTLKPLVAASAVDARLVRTEEIFNCESGQYPYAGHVIRDVHPVGVVPFAQVLVRSSNICIAKIGQRLGKQRLYNALRGYGFGQRTGIELSGEGDGILRSPETWADIDLATHSFGQGISVTALQLVQGYAVLANGGYLVHPTLLKQSQENNQSRKRVLSEQTARKISEILQGVTEDEHGTGHNARINGVTVCGKTGTAQKARNDGRGYSTEQIMASFIGYVDGNEIGVNHRLVMFVAVDEPQVKPRWGGVVAAPVFRRSMERILSHLMTRERGAQVQTASLRRDKEGWS